ncbi:MAG: ATP-binding protein [Mycoplasmoidaceae bacterium]|nr:MAG: ATP-binding protein [Mycoplasmoidaceae bacterium]
MNLLVQKGKRIQREYYLQQIIKYIKIDLIKVISGIRRCGKSVLLEDLYLYLINKKIPNSSILYVNFDAEENNSLLNLNNLKARVDDFISNNINNQRYILFDEIQDVNGFEKYVLGLYQDKLNDIYITGSNSKLNSKQIASKFVGRTKIINIYPYSFEEFTTYKKEILHSNENNTKLFLEYISNGGMPITLNMNNDKEMINDYLKGVVTQIIVKDIFENYKIQYQDIFWKLLLYIMDTTSQTFAIQNIIDVFTKKYGKVIKTSIIEKYINYMCDTYLLSKVKRYDVEGNKILKIYDKYYAIDTGIRNALVNKNEKNNSWLLETIVYNELIRKQYTVLIGKVNYYQKDSNGKTIRVENEVDFIASKDNETLYIQVSWTVNDKGSVTWNREISPLLHIKKANVKLFIVTTDVIDETQNGVKFINIFDFFKFI